MRHFHIKLIPRDGIGVEVVREAVRVLNALAEKHGGIGLDFHSLEWSCQYFLKTGRMMPEDGMKILADCCAILPGAAKRPARRGGAGRRSERERRSVETRVGPDYRRSGSFPKISFSFANSTLGRRS